MTDELLKRIEEYNIIDAEQHRLREVRNVMLCSLAFEMRKNFKYSFPNYSNKKSEVGFQLDSYVYIDDFWSIVTIEKIESNDLDYIICNKENLHIGFLTHTESIAEISAKSGVYSISYDNLIKLYNHSDRDKLLELILSGADSAQIALQILNPE
jgi:hypothetical protein